MIRRGAEAGLTAGLTCRRRSTCRSDTPRPWRAGGVALALAVAGSACGSPDARSTPPYEDYLRVVAIEDARPASGAELDSLVTLAGSDEPFMRHVALRALGRLEEPSLLPVIAEGLADEDAVVRASAADALARSVHGTSGEAALGPLVARAAVESDPSARGAIAYALARLSIADERRDDVLRILLEWSTPSAAPEAALGIVRGIETLSRTPGRSFADPALVARLHELARFRAPRGPGATGASAAGDAPRAGGTVVAARVRAVALLALGQRGRLETDVLSAGLEDPHAIVRHAAAGFLVSADPAARRQLAARALQDTEPTVRIESVRALASLEGDTERCSGLLSVAGDDPSLGVRVVALQEIDTACTAEMRGPVVDYLTDLAGAERAVAGDLGTGEFPWQTSAAALEALARIAPDRAREPLGLLARHPVPFARAAAARVAGATGDAEILRALAADPHPNVRVAALPALAAHDDPTLDSLLVAQLDSDDPQLLITAAQLLEGPPNQWIADAVLAALERVSAARRETARDARMALLGAVRSRGDARLASRVEPYLGDHDPEVGDEAAAVLEEWTGEPRTARPSPLPRLPLPTADELRTLERTRVILTMERGGRIVIEPLPLIAPTNAHRFVRLAREGYFDGLTFHRWVPNFVVQGGSPGANEYSGDGPFTRDELGHPHWRGTVGLSTRGRDTGDGQIFVNLVDNIRLDGDYTIFGRVVSGMDVVDGLLEGDVIATAEVRVED